ncbi:MAG: trigger factor, partial [Mariprofundaceae bacterium]|nr:trigger factor [Mariprofundaceae bacterium]
DAIEKSGLMPALQPELEFPADQKEEGFRFTLKVVTWPDVKLKPLGKISVENTEVTVGDADMQSVIDRLMETQVSYNEEEGRAAQQGDQVSIDFTGFVDDEPFEGGRGEDVKLVIGAGQFIPGFEEGLSGAKAGEDRSLDVTFPEEYQHKPLAGKAARFEVVVKSVAASVKADNEEDLAKLVNFDDASALRADIRSRLEQEAKDASYNSSRDALFDALIAAHEIKLPEALVQQDMQQSKQRVVKSMQDQSMEVKPEMFEDQVWKDELRQRSERALSISLLLSSLREANSIEISEDEVEAELNGQAGQYPADQLDAFKSWMKSQKEQMAGLRDKLLEKKCVTCIMEQVKTKPVSMSLDAWQAKQDAANGAQA